MNKSTLITSVFTTSVFTTGVRWLWLAALVFIIDILTKFWVLHHFTLYESVQLLPFFSFTYVHNYGAAFSSFIGQRWPLAVVAITISIILIVMMYRSSAKERLVNCAFALIIGGALGNLFDRLYHGFVVDFLHFYYQSWSFPVFNFADVAICIGAALVILDGFFGSAKNEQ